MVLGGLSQNWLGWVRLLMSHSRATVLVNYSEGTVLWTISSPDPEIQAQIPGLLRSLMATLAQKVGNFFRVTTIITETEEPLRV
ncbi:hypothetical protein ES708_00235 [subsurface metagenome]